MLVFAIEIRTECSHINAWQPRHARTKTDPIQKSRAGLGSWENLGPRVARIATTMTLNAALVCCLFAIVDSPFSVISCFWCPVHSIRIHTECSYTNAYQARHARIKMVPIHESHVGPGSWQNLGPRVARLAAMTGLTAAFVRYLRALVS